LRAEGFQPANLFLVYANYAAPQMAHCVKSISGEFKFKVHHLR
jgi:hypothetical protein